MTTVGKKSARPDRSKKERTPLSSRNRLTFDAMEEGYVYRVINDKDDRLQRALDGGYEFVESTEKLGDERAAEGTAIDSRVSKPVGNGITGFLMRIPDGFYKEDQAAKETDLRKTEAAMKPKTDQDQYGDGLTDE
jgi:hypothetical protein